MYKFKPEAFVEIFTEESIDTLVDFCYRLSYSIKKQIGLKMNPSHRDNISRHDYRQFKEKYEELLKNNLFSNYLIELEFNSLVDLDVFDADISVIPEFYVLRLGENRIVLRSLACFQEKPMTNLNDIDITKLQSTINHLITTNNNSDIVDPEILLPEKSGQSFNATIEHKHDLQKIKEEYDATKKAIEAEQHEALETLRIEKERILGEMEQKKQNMLAEMRDKELALQKKMYELNKEISIMDAQIYDIQSYLGETYEILAVRSGKKAPLEQPFTINQKIRFLDEDLPIIIGLYGNDLNENNYDNLVQAFKYSDKLVDYFCQTDKSLTFFRLSRDKDVISKFVGSRENNDNRGRFAEFCIKQIVNEKGHDFVGFVLKNGECLYFGVLDQGKRIIVEEDVFCDITAPEQTVAFNQMSEQQATDYKKKQAKDRLARKFMFSLIQGLIDNKKFITFDEPVNVFTMPPQIIFSSASGWIETKRFGEFEWLKHKLNFMTRTDDTVFVHNTINDGNRIKTYFNGYLPSIEDIFGIKQIEKVEINEQGKHIFIKTKRDSVAWDANDVNSLIKVYKHEFINIEYMNSKWINYFISIKAVDQTDQGRYFPIMVKNWMVIRDFLLKREDLERDKISDFYPDIDNVLDWPVKLSEWKLQQKIPVRKITDYQAKRFAKALTNNEIKPIPFMYEENYDAIINKRDIIAPEKALDEDFEMISTHVNKYVNKLINLSKEQTANNEEYFYNAIKNRISLDLDNELSFKSSIMNETLYHEMFDYGLSTIHDRITTKEIKNISNRNYSFTDWRLKDKDFSNFKTSLKSEIEANENSLADFFVNEITHLKKTFDYDMIGNRDQIAKTLTQLRNVLNVGIQSTADDDHRELIKALLEINNLPDFCDNSDFKLVRHATIARSSMAPAYEKERTDLISRSGDLIGVSVFYKKGYYDKYLVFDKNDLGKIYLHSYLNLMRFKYNLAIDAINSFPYFRTI